MIRTRVKVEDNFRAAERKAQQGAFESLGQAAGYLRKVARHSIIVSDQYAEPGHPPHSRRGQLREAILYAVEKDAGVAVIGPVFEQVGRSGAVHEFGGRYRGDEYEPRPFMGPALRQVLPRLPSFWEASVK